MGEAGPNEPFHRSDLNKQHQPLLNCPQCGSTLNWKDGSRYGNNEEKIQRYVCRQCSYRFSETTLNGSNPSEDVQKVQTNDLNVSKVDHDTFSHFIIN